MAGEMTILGSAVLTLLLAGYLAQQYLPLPTPKVIGIDLGTTYCSVGVFFPGTGKVKVIPDENGHISIPSMVSFTDDDVYVGYESLELADSNPQNTIYDAKRFIGKIFTPEELEAEVGRYPFKCMLMNCSSPPNLAGLKILRVINEPTAAAMAYGLHKVDVFHVLVIDLGGGTLDVSLLNKQGGMFVTRAMSGNNKLGGQDFNQRLLQYLYKQIHQTYGFLPSRKEEIHRLRQAVEMVKLNLTLHQSAQVSVLLTVEKEDKKEPQSSELLKDRLSPAKGHRVNGMLGASHLQQKSGESQVLFETEISRKLFDTLNEDLFQKILVPIQQVLKEGHLEKTEIDEVVLVGGSTRIPRIRQVIQEFFGKDPNTSVDPDLAVVTGVAIQAGIDGGSWPLQVSALEIPNKHLQKTNFN
ncbi:PREDICTED: heat shock 70 kDa protein 13 [Condylura cristata]|uniref:heat shock 70 kDa protein 13 n=1 Tax=Condylura cristata TaxID=143302 RepID=UPI000643BC8D|nr:PREDICTED: heat shock 70 kDa protein 13 [Condylura cristata]